MAKDNTDSTEEKELKPPSSGVFVFRIDPSKRGAALKVFIAGVLALILFSVVINSYVQLNEVYSDISTANSDLNILRRRSWKVRLRSAISKIMQSSIWGFSR